MKTRLLLFLILFFSISAFAQDKKQDPQKIENPKYKSALLSGLKFRSIGPAFTSGRIGDIAVNPNKHSEYYLAVASGGVWKTTNSGTTFEPIFDSQGSYSIGCITLAPSNSNVVWVGTGENNNQRSVAYGDGVYKSTDGGESWENMGLENSEHIGMIAIHPEDESTVYVAAYGPLWSPGGDRGIYKTTDGGETWEKILDVSENTGFNEIHMDPRTPEVMYATAHQRRRRVFTYIDGGPETAIYKSTDGGKNWRKLTKGLPSGDKGRIGMDISPVNPDVVYAIIKATEGGGFFRSDDRGESWKKMSDYQTSGNYYQEIICDRFDVNTVYSMNTWLHHTDDGGKTFKRTGEKDKHVDNHCLWQDPDDPDHWRIGCDGGVYETWNAAEDWKYFSNLPVTQFYKVALDNAEPFYNVYGGTQDNNTQGGPSQTNSVHGILNSDWYITNGGDGFEPQVDPTNPDIVYGQAQYGWLVRYDKASGERVPIQPQPEAGDEAFRWNWDSPLLISPHNHKTLYFCANVVFKSEDRGNSWTRISEDLTREIDRNQLEVMGKVWGPDAVMKNKSTSIYGNIVAFDESPLQQGLLYAGTDDGLIQVSENDGDSWTEYGSFPGVPEKTYVNMLIASKHDANTVFAVFNNHKNGDFNPYILKSTNRGESWTAIRGNLPQRGSVYSLAQDHKNPDLIFAGTEFGAFFTDNGGKSWSQLKAGLPTIAVRDMEIQQREDDLVLATFGRGFYILDDYSPLRDLKNTLPDTGAVIFPVKDALMYIPSNKLGLSGKSSQGASLYAADNPPFGAVFTFYSADTLTTRKEARQTEEKEKEKAGENIDYPSLEEFRAEDREEKPYLLFVVKDSDGNTVRKIKQTAAKGIQRANWNLRYTSTSPIKLKESKPGRYSSPDEGMLALPGKYTVVLYKVQDGALSAMSSPVEFNVNALDNQSIIASDKSEVLAFQQKVAELARSLDGTKKLFRENGKKIKYIQKAIIQFPSAPLEYLSRIDSLKERQYRVKLSLYGDDTRSRRDMETLPGLSGRLSYAQYTSWWNTAEPTQTARKQFEMVEKDYGNLLEEVKSISRAITQLEKDLVEHKVPYTPGRGEYWKDE